jgi:hypothetical protein
MKDKINIRPEILGINDVKDISDVEYFQNTTLRPIIKLQHSLLIAFYKEYLISRKTDFKNLSKEQAILFINNSLAKDNRLKNRVLGLIMGLFTVEEFHVYTKKSAEINKRIFGIIKQRFSDSLSELV